MKKIIIVSFLISLITIFNIKCDDYDTSDQLDGDDQEVNPDLSTPVKRGQYLATIGVCNACHTPPQSGSTLNGASLEDSILKDIRSRSNPDWYADLDTTKEMSGGVPFWMRFGDNINGVVFSKNITSDMTTGIGNWTNQELYTVIKTGKRKDGSSLFLFPPHSFFKNLADDDVNALISYLRTLKPISRQIQPPNLPFPTQADSLIKIAKAPTGRSIERGKYLTGAIVGCAECHSYTDKSGSFKKFAGGNPEDPFLGVFKLGPDLPLRQTEKGFSAFPYPGYALIYSGNLTRFGKGGDRSNMLDKKIVNAIREGIKIDKDVYGRQEPMGHIMMWQYYRFMSDDDVYSIVAYLKSIDYIPNPAPSGLFNYGTNWELAFEKMFGKKPTLVDSQFFGK